MKCVAVIPFIFLIASPVLAASDPCEPYGDAFTPPPGQNPMIDFQRQQQERRCFEQRQKEKADLQHQIDMLTLQQRRGEAAPLPTPLPRASAPSLKSVPKKKVDVACLPTPKEIKALAKLYEYELKVDVARKQAEAMGESYYGSNYWEEWHTGKDPSRKAVDRLGRCGYDFPAAWGADE